jgi:hypothetical protein
MRGEWHLECDIAMTQNIARTNIAYVSLRIEEVRNSKPQHKKIFFHHDVVPSLR